MQIFHCILDFVLGKFLMELLGQRLYTFLRLFAEENFKNETLRFNSTGNP